MKYLCIEDLCGQFEIPSVLDIKIGPITYDSLATEEKIKKDINKYPPVEIFGFRILGMKASIQSMFVIPFNTKLRTRGQK